METMESPQGSLCQSCGMPFQKPEDHGTNKDGSRSAEYCRHCFQGGRFLDDCVSVQEKIEKNVKIGVKMGMPEETARHMAVTILPKLKRWKNG